MSLSGVLEGAEGGDMFAEDRKRFHHRHKKRRGSTRLASMVSYLLIIYKSFITVL